MAARRFLTALTIGNRMKMYIVFQRKGCDLM